MVNFEEQLDSANTKDHVASLAYKHTYNFSTAVRFATGVVAVFFCITFLMALVSLNLLWILVTFVFLFGCLFVVLSYSGTQVALESEAVKEYVGFLGLKRGNWKNLRPYTDVAILTIRSKKVRRSAIGADLGTVDKKETGIYILTPSHRKRILIRSCGSTQEALERGKAFAEETGKSFTVFNPKVSEATKARRYR